MPSIREELSLNEAATLKDGQPSWTIHDPVRNQFFMIDWQAFEILRRWHLSNAQEIVDDINRHTTLQLSTTNVDEVSYFLRSNELLRPKGGEDLRAMSLKFQQSRANWTQWLLHNYLFFRVPLVRPDRWLNANVGRVKFFFSSWFAYLTLSIFCFAIFEVSRDWDRFWSSMVDMISLQGLMFYAVAVAGVKVLHELGHAFTAKRYGCRVPTMGLAFLVLWPVAYTDTNEVWRLKDRKQKLAVASAGIVVELSIAVWATALWVILPDGHLKSIAFVLSTSTWISSLLINLSPFMRFDGYFLLADFLELPNLHQRSFALARWDLRERIFGLGEPPPELFSKRTRQFLIVFAYATWIYRLVLFLGIAALVYTFFIKLVGLFLFAVEIVWFVLMPIMRELRVWRDNWSRFSAGYRVRRSTLWTLFLVILLILPWPTRVSGTAILKPAKSFSIYVPNSAQLIEMPWKDGAMVRQGETLFKLDSPELLTRFSKAKARLQQAQWQVETSGVDGGQRSNALLFQQQLELAKAEYAQVESDLALFEFQAPFSGELRFSDPDVQVGSWFAHREKLASLIDVGPNIVETYFDEEQVRRIEVGDDALFAFEGRPDKFLHLTVVSIDRDVTHVLPNALFALPTGGHLAVRERRGQLIPDKAIYRVTLKSETTLADANTWRGEVHVKGRWESPILRYLKTAMVVFWRELGM